MRFTFHCFCALLTALAIGLLCSETLAQEGRGVRVGIFEGEGVGKSAKTVVDTLQQHLEKRYEICRITPHEIQQGALSKLDVLVHPGGSGSKQGKALGEAGRKAVVDFVKRGGGYLGICAGSYLATNDYSWSLHLIDAKVVDRKHWARGTGKVKLKLSPAAAEFFGDDSENMELHYGQGPLLGRREWDSEDVPDYESLAIFQSEIAKNGAPKGIMVGTSAIVRASFGEGRIFCFSPHPELTEGRGAMLAVALQWLAQDPP